MLDAVRSDMIGLGTALYFGNIMMRATFVVAALIVLGSDVGWCRELKFSGAPDAVAAEVAGNSKILNLGKIVETTIEFQKDKIRDFDSSQLCPTCSGVNPLPNPCGPSKRAKVVIRSMPSELPVVVRSLEGLMDPESSANTNIAVAVRSLPRGGDRMDVDPVPTPCK